MLPDDDKWYAIETCRSSESVLKKLFKINDIQLVHFVGCVMISELVEVLVLVEVVQINGTHLVRLSVRNAEL